MDLKRLLHFGKKLRLETRSFNELVSSPEDLMTKIRKNRRLVVRVNSVFNRSELSTIQSSLQDIPESLVGIPHPGAATFPPACSNGQDSVKELNSFFNKSAFYNTSLSNLPKVNVVTRFSALITSLNAGVRPILANNSRIGKNYLHGTFRFIEPNPNSVGLTTPHTGFDYVDRNINCSYKPLSSYVDVYRQLSLFTLIKRPHTGGDFTLFNFDREQYPILQDGGVKKHPHGKVYQFYNKNHEFLTVKLNDGDALLFSDYNTWHRVEPVSGDYGRISYGCWLGFGKQKNELYYWS